MKWDNVLEFHSEEGGSSCSNHFPLRFIFHRLDPGGITIDLVDDHPVVVAAAGRMQESTCLICIYRVAGIIECYENVLLFCNGRGHSSGGLLSHGGSHPLALVFHVSLLGFFGLGEILVDVLDVEKVPGEVATFVDGLEPGCLGGETCGAVKVLDGWLYGGEFIDVIDEFCWGRLVVAAR